MGADNFRGMQEFTKGREAVHCPSMSQPGCRGTTASCYREQEEAKGEREEGGRGE